MSRQHVEALLNKARDTDKSDDAVKFSQAACNIAHATRTLREVDALASQIEKASNVP